MAAVRHRQSGATSIARVELPPYEPLQHSLTPKAQQELTALLTRHPLKALDKYQTQALELLGENVAAINDTFNDKKTHVEEQRRKHGASSSQDNDTEEELEKAEASLGEMKTKLDDMTHRMEGAVLKMIDHQTVIANVREVIGTLSRDPVYTTGSQRHGQSQPRASMPGTFDDDDNDVPSTMTPTEAGHTQNLSVPPPLQQKFTSILSRKRDRWEAYSRSQRYAKNNSYRQFKKLMHDSRHPEVPVPHESTWFPEPGAPQPGVTRGSRAGEDSDDDLAVAQENISTKCPLTLRDFVDPVTSHKCPHSFERSAIEDYIGQSTLCMVPASDGTNPPVDVTEEDALSTTQGSSQMRVVSTQQHRGRGRGGGSAQSGLKVAKCPVTGCDKMLTKADFSVDHVLKRKIARLLKAQQLAEEGSGSEDEEGEDGVRARKRRGGKRHDAVSLGSESGDEIEDDAEVVTGTGRRRVLKGEREGSIEL